MIGYWFAWWDVPIAAVCATFFTWLVKDALRMRRADREWIAQMRDETQQKVYRGETALMDAIFDVLPDDARGREASKLASPASRPLLYSVPQEAERVSLRIVGNAIDETVGRAS